MGKQISAKGQITINVLQDAYNITQSIKEYIFPANHLGVVKETIKFTSKVSVSLGEYILDEFEIGAIRIPSGFSSIDIDNKNKTISYSVSANTSELADSGSLTIPIIIEGIEYPLSFAWSKSKDGASGEDLNLLDWVKDWNTNKTQVGANSVITPKIFAGVKNANSTLTGIALGNFELSTVGPSGSITSELINGLYGFNNGHKTFYIDNSGNTQIGRGNQFIRFNANTGKIEFGSDVSMNWINEISNSKDEIINKAIESAIDVVSNLQAVNPNYLNNSSNWRKSGWNNGYMNNGGGYEIDESVLYNGKPTLKTYAGTGLYHPWIKLQMDVAYTYSAMVLCERNAPGHRYYPLHFRSGFNNANEGKSVIVKCDNSVTANSWKKIYVTFKLTDDADSFMPFFYWDSVYVGNTYWIAYFKLEQGENATEWVPSVSDTNANIEEAKQAGDDAKYIAELISNKATEQQWETRLTYIDQKGIFTGTLSANTINAISLNASQIVSGVISADRIAAGSINANKLNAASIKSDLINATYINGLSCNFTRGTIGGWIIEKDSIKNSNLVLDQANTRIATFGESSSSTSGKRVQLFYNSNNDFGIFASDSTGTCVARLGSSNIIAGWTIDADSIYSGTKNNTVLGFTPTSGSITIGSNGIRGHKWRLDSNGSGSIAGGNISWNESGTVTFSQSVSLNWTNAIDTAMKSNYGYPYYKKIVIYGESSKYYPVIIKGGNQFHKRDIFIRREYSEQAPNDWHNSTHKGGLILLIKTNFGGWGGSTYSWDIYELSETYCNMFAGASHLGNMMHFGVYLRGGGATGAIYHLYSDQPLDSQSYSPTPNPEAPQICYNQEVYWASGTSQFTAPVPRTRTSGDIEEIRRRRFISLCQESDSYLTNHPLTYIGSTGIYTGTLTANQVNAVEINASSIKTGTLSVDRLAASSITGDKLNVTSVQASIVTASAVNGLTCSFTKGTIGGWTIGSDTITVGTIGGGGAIPIQIRSSSSGTSGGYWYSGAYKPYGITMTWHQSNNAGHIVIGQIASNGNNPKTGFIGIQMMSWDHCEYFCLSANYTKSGGKEVYNRIAGWGFDNTSIWKNNVYLSADGSITNGSYWRLNSDGSGQVAGGNISWNSSGTVSFSSSVQLNWVNAANSAADGAKELALAMAFGKMLYRDPTFINGNNSINVYNNSGNGTVSITRISDSTAPNDNKISLVIKNTGSASPNCGGFYFATGTSYRRVLIARIVAKIPVGRNIEFHSNSIGTGGYQKWLTSVSGTGDWAEYICKIVAGTSGTFSSTCFFAVTGAFGTVSAPVEWKLAYATVFDLTSNEGYTTTIDANGIYTGTVKAGQILVDSALIVGGSSYNGSISVRDASNIVKVTLDRSGITAVGGTIGGWVIASSQISKNGIILGSDGSITNGTKWKLNYDGSGQFANGNITWTTAGSVSMTGTINASSGSIGGFEIGYGRIGTSASASGSGGGLAIYNDFFRVGSTISYAMLGDDCFPSTAGGAFKTTCRITNTRTDSYNANIGVYIDVKNALRNYGIHSNAAIMGSSLISTRAKVMSFGSGNYTIDFSQYNVFYVYATTSCSVTMPTEASVRSMFGLSTLPSDFACVFTFVYNYNWGNSVTFNSLQNQNGGTSNYQLSKGDSITVVCAKYPSFHYQVINHYS